MTSPTDTIAARATTHGNFQLQGALAHMMKRLIRESPHYGDMAPQQAEALDQILTKISRICCGNARHADHWHDIAGYAGLGEDIANERGNAA